MDFSYTDTQKEIAEVLRGLCARFPAEYWRRCGAELAYPSQFVHAMTEAGWLSALIPEAYGGSGLSLLDACVILQEINAKGGNGATCHAQMYTMASVLQHGIEQQKQKILPRIAAGTLRLQAFGITEPTAGSNTLRIKTFAKKVDGGYLINGQKIWTSRFRQSDINLLLARTTPYEDVARKTEGLSLFLVDIKAAGKALQPRTIDTMLNHHTNEVFIENLEVADEWRVGEDGEGFKYLLSSLNAERLLVASECVGDGKWFIEKARKYAAERIVFDKPIGANQGVAFPIAKAHMNLSAAELLRNQVATLFDAKQPCGGEANMAKYLCSEASWEAAEAAMTTFGGFGWRPSTTSNESGRRRGCSVLRRSPTTSYSRMWRSTCWRCRAPIELVFFSGEGKRLR